MFFCLLFVNLPTKVDARRTVTTFTLNVNDFPPRKWFSTETNVPSCRIKPGCDFLSGTLYSSRTSQKLLITDLVSDSFPGGKENRKFSLYN